MQHKSTLNFYWIGSRIRTQVPETWQTTEGLAECTLQEMDGIYNVRANEGGTVAECFKVQLARENKLKPTDLKFANQPGKS